MHGQLQVHVGADTVPGRLSWDGSGAARRAERRYRVLRVLSYNSAEKGGRCHSVMLGGGAGNEGFAIWILATCSKPVNYTGYYCDMPSYSTQPPHPNMALLQLLRTVVALIGALSGNSELCIVPLSSQ